MTLKQQIGTMVFTQNQKEAYIIGGSQRQNKEFQEQTKHIISYNSSQDRVEINGIVKQEYSCENYNDIIKLNPKGMPSNCLGNELGYKLNREIYTAFKDYHKEQLSEEDLSQMLIEYCKEMRIYQTQIRNTTGTNKKDNQQIILNIYEIFQKLNARGAVGACHEEGEKVAKKYDGRERDWIYYNSNYHYQTEHMREILQNAAKQVAKEWNIEELDFETCEKETKYILDGKLDFNSVWKHGAEQTYIGTMLNPQDIPPKNFTFYFQEHRNKYKHFDDYYCYEAQKGVIRISIGKEILELDVPFDADKKEKQYFLAGDLVRKHASKEFIEKTEGFADHFFVFLRQFGTILNWYEFS